MFFNIEIKWLTDRFLAEIEENVNLGTKGVHRFVFLGQPRSNGRIPCSMNRPLHLQIDFGFAAFQRSKLKDRDQRFIDRHRSNCLNPLEWILHPFGFHPPMARA